MAIFLPDIYQIRSFNPYESLTTEVVATQNLAELEQVLRKRG